MRQENLEQRISGFEKIRLEVGRPDLCNSDNPDVRIVYILGKNGGVLIQATAVRKPNGEHVDFVGSFQNKPLEYELSGDVIWGCVKGKKIERYPYLEIDNNTFTIQPVKGYIPIKASNLGFFNGKYVGQILDIRPVIQKELDTANLLLESWKKEQERRNEAREIPVKVGQDIYLGTEMFLSHGADDFLGGLCKVIEVRKEYENIWVSVAETKGGYNWTSFLAENQEKWRKEYGTRRGRPDPDLKPEFNQWD